MRTWRKLYKADLERYGENKVDGWTKSFLKAYRKAHEATAKPIFILRRIKLRILSRAKHIEIPAVTNIGPGLYIGHPLGITINPDVRIGRNCNIHKGVTIGQENRGNRMGVPTIGDEVYLGINATVVGKIHIGNDVLIAPNAYVNMDVPDYSIVIGNPSRIIPKKQATLGYINHVTAIANGDNAKEN